MVREKGLQSKFIANFWILRMHNNLYLQMYIHFLRCVSFTPPIQVFSCVASLWTSWIFLFWQSHFCPLVCERSLALVFTVVLLTFVVSEPVDFLCNWLNTNYRCCKYSLGTFKLRQLDTCIFSSVFKSKWTLWRSWQLWKDLTLKSWNLNHVSTRPI